jgi:hypothetical protein
MPIADGTDKIRLSEKYSRGEQMQLLCPFRNVIAIAKICLRAHCEVNFMSKVSPAKLNLHMIAEASRKLKLAVRRRT